MEGNKARKGREVPAPADLVASLVESPGDLASMHAKERHRPIFDIGRQWVRKPMKEAGVTAGLDPARAHPHAPGHTYGRNVVLAGVPTPVLRSWPGHQSLSETERCVKLSGGRQEWAERL